jgi:HEAT repeat protein
MLVRVSKPREYRVFMQEKALHALSKDARMQAVDYLGKRKDPATLDSLLKVLQEDPQASVRFSAVLALSKIGGNAAMHGLLTAIEHDPDSGVRIESVRMLYLHKHQNLAPVIIALLEKETDFWVRYDAAKMLGKLAKKTLVDAAAVIPIITRDLNSLKDTDSLKFALGIALLRLEGPDGAARQVLERMRDAGTLVDYQVTKP